jgi:HlyD family secretion protein
MARWRRLLFVALLVGLTACVEEQREPTAADAPAGDPPAAIARCRIDVEGGVIRVAGQREGVIETVAVEEGDRVVRGQVLARIDMRQAELRIAVATAELEEVGTRVDAATIRHAAALRERARRQAAGADAVGLRQIDEADTEAHARRTDLAAARAAAAVAARRLDEARHEIEARTVRAPADGVVVRRRARPGEGVAIQAVTELFQLLPDAPRIARCDLEELFLPGVAVGQAATLVAESDDRRSFDARVKRISDVFGLPAPTDDPTARADLRTLEMVLTIEEGAPLRIGQRVRATIPSRASRSDSR